MKEDFAKYLESFVTPNRAIRINENLTNRTRYLTVVLENVYQSHNVSAILRTCDCFGIQDAHIIENNNAYKTNPEIALGADQWLTIHNYNKTNNNTSFAVKYLKSKGYRIVATSSHAENDNLDKLDLKKGKVAFVFGTELSGVTPTIEEMADEFIKIPMFGFTESFNISVSAGILLYHFSSQLRSSDINWRLSDEEFLEIKIDWLKKSIKRPDLIEKYFHEKNSGSIE